MNIKKRVERLERLILKDNNATHYCPSCKGGTLRLSHHGSRYMCSNCNQEYELWGNALTIAYNAYEYQIVKGD
uniref:Transposase n=1 Tax=viral metagenome TaxID=1070528 RepID=A0A6M3K4Q3_9ZZZZ